MTKELHSDMIKDTNAGNINENNKVSSYIQFNLTIFECLDFIRPFL